MRSYVVRQCMIGARGLAAALYGVIKLGLVCAFASTIGLVWMQYYGHALLVTVVLLGLWLLSHYLLIEAWGRHAQ